MNQRLSRPGYGFVLMLIGLAIWAQLGVALPSAQAQPLPPRPTPRPTATPRPAGEHHGASPLATGRIAGTVIDLTSGAPAAGVVVAVGDLVLTTDANGNYDRAGLAAGTYTVALKLAADRGVPVQAPVVVQLADAATVIQHLAFRSPLPAPAAQPAPVAPLPAELPRTGDPGLLGWWWAIAGLVALLAGGAIRLRARR